jgi:hypothetical protein
VTAPVTVEGDVREDFVAFCDRFNEPLFDWQREVAGEAFKREGGRFKYRLVAISAPRGDGKSALAIKLGRWLLLRKPRQHILTAALTTTGTRVVLDGGRRGFRGVQHGGVKVLKDAILIPTTESRWTITSREHTSSRGEHPDCVLYDEGGWSLDDELFASLLAAQASCADPLFVMVSTVGKRRSGPLWKIKELAEAGDPSVYWHHHSTNRSPLVTAEFLARQRRILLPQQYAREHQNQWVDGADAITTASDVDWAMNQGWGETAAQEGDATYEGFVDLGLVHDATVLALGHREGELILIDRIETLEGDRERPVSLAAVEERLLDWHARFDVRRIRIESWQGVASAQRLAALGLPAEIQTPTTKTNSEEWPQLIQALAGHRLILPEHARLREELLNLTYEITATGVKVVDRGSVHQDHATAVRGTVAGLLRPAPVRAALWG